MKQKVIRYGFDYILHRSNWFIDQSKGQDEKLKHLENKENRHERIQTSITYQLMIIKNFTT